MRPVDEAAVEDLGTARDHPVIRVRGGTGHVSVAGLACCRPGYRIRLIQWLHCYRGRKGEARPFIWAEYRDLLIAASPEPG